MAFQSLLQKLRPSSICFSSKRMSCPAGAMRIMPKRSPSAPYFAIRSSGSGELPNDLRHLASLLVANDAGEIRRLGTATSPGVFESRHDHARDPEENNIRRGHEIGRGIKLRPRGRHPSCQTARASSKTRCRARRDPASSFPRRMAARCRRGWLCRGFAASCFDTRPECDGPTRADG